MKGLRWNPTSASLPRFILGAMLLLLPACGGEEATTASNQGADTPKQAEVAIPNPDTRGMEPPVRRRLAEARRAVEAKPGSASAWGRYGMVADVHELDEVALASYAEARQLAPDDMRWPYLEGRLRTVQGADLDAGVELFERSLALDPDYIPARLRLAEALAQKGNLEAAAEAFRRVLKLAPDVPQAHLGLGQVLLRQGDAAAAVVAVERAHVLQPADAVALTTLSQIYRRLERREEAEIAARGAALREPVAILDDPVLQEVSAEGVSSTLLVERALEYLRTDRFREALADLLLAEEGRPEDPYLQRDLGRSYQGLGDVANAAVHYEKALALKADLVDARVLLGLSLMEAGRINEARPHLEQARREAPDDPDVALNVALALLQAGQLDGALSEFSRANTLGEVPAAAHNAWGSALAQRGRLREAMEHFEIVLENDPEDPQALCNLGLASEALGQRDKAVEYYRRAMALGPNPMAQERLTALTGTLP